MFVRMLFLFACLILTFVPIAHGQIFTDNVGNASLYTIAGDGDGSTVEDVRFGFDYGNFDIFGNSFITGSIAEAPNSVAGASSTTGIFISANNSSATSTSLFAGIYANGVNVGTGTATPNYVLRFDAFHSVTPGTDGVGPPSATNYQWSGINYTPAETPSSNGATGPYAGPFSAGTSGQTLAITGEQGAADDYEITIGNVTIEDRNEGFSGLATAHIEQQYIAAGFAADGSDYATPIGDFSHDAGHGTPMVADPAIFNITAPETWTRYWQEEFPPVTDPLHFDSFLANENDNDFLEGGTPYNSWASHEIYFVDGIWTHVINGTPILQVDPAAAGDGSQAVSDSGTFALGFLDGFSSFNDDPEGSNFVVYDNIELEGVAAGSAPSIVDYLIANNYAPASVLVGDYNEDGLVDAADFVIWRDSLGQNVTLPNQGAGAASPDVVDIEDYTFWADNYGASSTATSSLIGGTVPEPSSLLLCLLSLLGIGYRSRGVEK